MRRVRLALILLLLGASATFSQEGIAELLIRLEGGDNPGPADFALLVDGRPGEVTGIESVVHEDLPVLVYFDFPLCGSGGVEAAQEALLAAAPALTTMGPVELAGAFSPRTLPDDSEATRDPEVLAELLEYVSEELEQAGDLRRELWESDAAQAQDIQTRVKRSALALGAAAAQRTTREARLLVLVRDGVPRQAIDPEVARLQSELARALAAMGWTTLVLAPSGPVSPDGFLGLLASASGGEILADPGGVASALDEIRERWRLSLRLPGGSSGGDPEPLLVTSRRAGLVPTAPGWVSGATPEVLALARADGVLEAGEGTGDLDVLSRFSVEERRDGTLSCVVDVSLPLTRLLRKGGQFRASVVGPLMDGTDIVQHWSQTESDLSGKTLWVLRAKLILEEEPRDLAVVLEETGSGLWGGSLAEASDSVQTPSGPGVVVRHAEISLVEEEEERDPESMQEAPFRLLPPKSQPAKGKVKIRTVVADPGIHHVIFEMDGRQVGSDEKAPFSVDVDLGREAKPHTIKAVAYDEFDEPLGQDTVHLNEPARAFRVSVDSVTPVEGGKAADVVATVNTPRGIELERVEFFGNDTMAASREHPPFEARVPLAGIEAADYVRVVAWLTDGTSAEDVSLLIPGFLDEEVEVNLVEVYVVVTDKDGVPVQDLSVGDFELRRGRRSQAIDLFAPGDERDLSLGLVIDTSESMATIIVETKRAASRFVQDTLREGDRAFLVDFDTRPRLALGTTDDLLDLVRALGYLQADGFTAMWDAILFGLRELGDEPGRKALVLLTDGDDYKSRYGVSRVIDDARRQGVPVYILALAGLDGTRPSFKKMDLDAIAKQTGGRVFYISRQEELGQAYVRINQELRSQVILAFAAPRDLTQDELQNLEVRIKRPGLEVRSVASGRAMR